MFVQVAKLWDTTSLQIIAAMRENGQRILGAQSFQTLRGNEWLDSDVSDSGEKLFVSIPSIVVIQTEYCRVFILRTSCLLKNK